MQNDIPANRTTRDAEYTPCDKINHRDAKTCNTMIDAGFSAKVRRFWPGKIPRTEFYYHESYNAG
jgi:hypothetical protein